LIIHEEEARETTPGGPATPQAIPRRAEEKRKVFFSSAARLDRISSQPHHD
jgi:hypothetical protein